MKNDSALTTLIRLAAEAADDAARRLGAATREADQATQQLQLLQQYRGEYAMRLRTSAQQGVTMSGYRNFQLFIEKLDHAIQSQETVIDQAKKQVEGQRTAWQVAERKRLSYELLQQRNEEALRKKENKRDQKLMDEHATRGAFYKRS